MTQETKPGVSTVHFSTLEPTHRINAEYYRPRYLELAATLARCPTKYLPEVCYVTDGNHFKVSDYFMLEGEYRYLRGQDLTDFFIGEANPVYIPKEVFDSLEASHIKPLDVLLSIVGTIGAVGIVPPDWPVITGSCKLAILRAQAIDPYYLAVFWASKYGKFQAERNTRGSVQMGIVLDDFPYLQVVDAPPAFQEEIAELVRTAYEQRQESKRLYRQAEKLLLDELGLSDLELSADLHNDVPFSKAWGARRFDAEFFQSKHELIEQRIRSLPEYTTLGSLGIVTNGDSPREYVDEGTPVIRAINLRDLDSEDNWLYVPPEDVKSYLNQGDVLISAIGFGSIGKVDVVGEGTKYTTVPEVIVVRTSKLSPFALQTYLSSKIGQAQLERPITGSTGQLHLFPWQVAQIPVPMPGDDLQQEVAELHIQARTAKRYSRELLEQAKHEVEALIENEAVHG